jgi:hypothetical protein
MDGALLSIAGNEATGIPYTGLAPAPAQPQWADVMGVVWDSPSLPNNATLSNLINVSRVVDVNAVTGALGPRGTNGFFIELLQNEKMLRRPVVLEGVAYFKTYQPTRPATECVSALGIDRFYILDSCNARALVDGNDFGTAIDNASDRVGYSAATDIGGDILTIFPKSGEPIVSHGNLGDDTKAQLPQKAQSRGRKLFMWKGSNPG